MFALTGHNSKLILAGQIEKKSLQAVVNQKRNEGCKKKVVCEIISLVFEEKSSCVEKFCQLLLLSYSYNF